MSQETPLVAFRLLQKDYRHDIALIDVYGSSLDLMRYSTGAPVEVEFGTGGRNTEVFYGYVNHPEPEVERLDSNETQRVSRIVAVGASWPLKESTQRSVRGRTASSLMREVAEAYRFTTDVQESDVVWDSMTSPGLTEWQFLVSLAQRMGYCFFCNKTEIRSFDQLDHLRRRPGTAPVFYGPDSAGENITIDNFTAVSGETTPDGGTKAFRISSGIDPRTGQVISVQNDPSTAARLGREAVAPFFQKFENLVVEDRAQGSQKLSSVALLNRFYIQAKATLLGDVKVTQGSIVALVGLGDRHSGYWYVHEVEHDLNKQRYEMHVVLGRDSLGTLGDEEAFSGRRTVRERFDPFDRRVAIPPPTIFVNDRWRSAYAAKKQVV
jgi:hypothetical protein